MNRLSPTVFVPNALALGSAAALPVPNDAVSGEVALLARIPIIHTQNPEAGAAETAPVSVNGAYAFARKPEPNRPQARGRSRRIAVARSSKGEDPCAALSPSPAGPLTTSPVRRAGLSS